MSDLEIVNLQILNINGEVEISFEEKINFPLDVSSLTSGIHMLMIQTKYNTYNKRIIKE